MKGSPPLDAEQYPALQALAALQDALSRQSCAILSAPPGSGKTTVVPLKLLDQPWLQDKTILLLEPRRIAARAAAARMSALVNERIGGVVGYQIRHERRISARTRIEVVTEGLLTRRLQSDPEMANVGLIIFDEFHERSLDADLALALTWEVRSHLRPDLRVLVMSATLETQRLAEMLENPPIVSASGRVYPVRQTYISGAPDQSLADKVGAGVRRALAENEGDVLAFLPGEAEIRASQRALQSGSDQVRIRPLYGALPASEQDLALRPDAQGHRKVILATNIAQTSLTVAGVRSVVDGGYVRMARFDLGAGANRLETLRISRATADQRAGRAGRLGPGKAYRLWSRDQHASLPAQDAPEILRADLARFALELALWGTQVPSDLKLLDVPPAANWNQACSQLRAIGALDAAARITDYGRRLARIPASPRIAHLLLQAAARDAIEDAAWIAATLASNTRLPSATDLAQVVASLRGQHKNGSPMYRTVEQFSRLARSGQRNSGARAEPAGLGELLAYAFPERLAQRRQGLRDAGGGRGEVAYLCADGGEARLAEHDPLAKSQYLAIAHWTPGAQRRIRLAAPIAETKVRAAFARDIQLEELVAWDARRQLVVAQAQEKLGAIVLSGRPLDASAEAVGDAMLQGIREMGVESLPWTEAARQLQARVQCARDWDVLSGLPDFSDAGLMSRLEDWLRPYLDGISRREQLSQLKLHQVLGDGLTFEQRQQLDRALPTHWQAPSGLMRALRYQLAAVPSLEIKLQEMFGCMQTPAVGDGRVAVQLKLLSPAGRPMAVTQDLAGFWQGAYREVRKQMRGRYPRHPWPEDPAQAVATHRAKPRKR